MDRGIVELDAIRYLEYQISKDVICVISTGGDESGAAGFVDGLVDCRLLPNNFAGKIIVSGTRINWVVLQILLLAARNYQRNSPRRNYAANA
jgi:hypothetical protein